MPSPTNQSIPAIPLPATMELRPPPSPRSHRALRRLQSAHTLGAKGGFQHSNLSTPSLISQQRLREQAQRRPSPTRSRELSNASTITSASTATTTVSSVALSLANAGPVQNPNRSPQRGRSNSDASSMQKNRTAKMDKANATANAMSIERLLRDGPPESDIRGALESLRLKILDQGIKSDVDGMSTSRIYAWLLLLDAPIMKTDDYLSLVHRGASPAYSKIRNDTFRTLTTDPLFRRRVSEASLIRLLNAIAWKLHDAREDRIRERPSLGGRPSLPPSRDGSVAPSVASSVSSAAHSATSSPAAKNRARALTLTTEGSETSGVAAEPGTYVQGMNVLAAPFLYAARSEAEAFVAFHMLLTRECPGYIRGAMDGVHKGLALVDKALAIVDPKLAMHLTAKGMSAEIYAFPSVLTLCACTPPLPEVLRLWDFLFAYGPHLNILCVVAQLVIIRNQIINSPTPNKVLRSFPSLHADQIKRTTLAIIKMIPDDVYAEIVAHAK
ncbi:hypothetical protein MKZ38_005382 [Zalerion maritima]|uniref:Rab-GAP TBC domain-containing protein n=1 Tax=Zalerion maritima TaxID=339359 RepID=A0AAD5RKH8_9PEZI|nr:hypothetical protein MKZ38_005382 [Zalerion maritima]